jgi:ISXO2-like transposase domain
MLHRIRLAMQTGSFDKLDGEVEVDESFIGGRGRNMHKDVRKRKITATGGKDKTIVLGIRQRDGEIRAGIVPNNRRSTLQAKVAEHVAPGRPLHRRAQRLRRARRHVRP